MSSPILYDIGTVERWDNSRQRVILEDIIPGIVENQLVDEQVTYRVARAKVLGQSGYNWYDVEVKASAESTQVGCSCRAGQNAVPCKHIAAVLIELGILKAPDLARGVRRQETMELDPVLEFLNKGGEL